MRRIFLNGSMNIDGNTAGLAKEVFRGLDYSPIHLAEHHINQIGQDSGGQQDDFQKVMEQLIKADDIVIGTPVYWSSMTGYLKTFIDRFADALDAPLASKRVFLLIQGTAPDDAIPYITNVIQHLCRRFHMNYIGLATNSKEAAKLHKQMVINMEKGR
ncbi:flavodoxin family protein [Bacillus sp. USDA818B3_A]|uniref:flavodoxin family protein n=1 Tax=Bacillus sp. USDA818B3_A TaxID=2698834 RepID=UPI00136DC9DA|nr:NAD(P)H-dependent oxidoreductase [Bacillus sp. USDA818B3_A]